MSLPNKIVPPSLPVATEEHEKRWQDQFSNILRLFFSQVSNAINAVNDPKDNYKLTDGVAEPDIAAGAGVIYIDKTDGDLKIKFQDGTVKTIVTDT